MKHYSKLKETKISSKTLFRGVLGVKLDEVKLLNGRTSTRLYFDHRGASGILPSPPASAKKGKPFWLAPARN